MERQRAVEVLSAGGEGIRHLALGMLICSQCEEKLWRVRDQL